MISKNPPFQVTLRTAWVMLFAALWVSAEFAFIEILLASREDCCGVLITEHCINVAIRYPSLLRPGNSTNTMDPGRPPSLTNSTAEAFPLTRHPFFLNPRFGMITSGNTASQLSC
ncbi:hypothetical protein ARMSODRAFT_212378 [Armillaria solidipes]|uniref:Uncharacterized protein n=1 Tax=Armillaria solidipes TaxID=1076256 RepID=A0A2H3BH38_9AGAR|nr:hypothetical protein ARMSODRAFT_212378 [Armillaria solidipes]